jgi:hypothetical protein
VPVVLAHDISHAQIGNAMHVANVGVAMLVALSSLARLHTASPDQFFYRLSTQTPVASQM